MLDIDGYQWLLIVIFQASAVVNNLWAKFIEIILLLGIYVTAFYGQAFIVVIISISLSIQMYHY